jgi:uncharacterized flavoprotein (TIGR03862 family)
MTSFSCCIIGAGPAGLSAAELLISKGVSVTIYDRMASPLRKFLMAGARGGLNLTNEAPLDSFLARYGESAPFLEAAIRHFSPQDLRAWCEELGQPTFTGNGGKIFPKTMKATPLARSWLKRLEEKGVHFVFGARWIGWDENDLLLFENKEGQRQTAACDAALLSLGGASWPHMGSDGLWTDILAARGIPITPWQPANCGFSVPFTEHFARLFAGNPLKSVTLTFKETTLQGELMLTKDGIEGGPVYALSSALRKEIGAHGQAILKIDLRPSLSKEALAEKLAKPRGSQSLSTFLRKSVALSPEAIGLIQEVAHQDDLPLSSSQDLENAIKTLPLRLTSTGPLERAISSAGGVKWEALDENYALRSHQYLFIAGEMIDWEAPTGGFLLQACFSTGRAAAYGILRRKNA